MVNQDAKLRRINARSYYWWILCVKGKGVEEKASRSFTPRVPGHTDELSLVPKAPLPTFYSTWATIHLITSGTSGSTPTVNIGVSG
jgi:hypothetical protein